MPDVYRIKWEIEVDASNSIEAAKLARIIQRDTESTANVFEVARLLNDGSHKPHYARSTIIDLDSSAPVIKEALT